MLWREVGAEEVCLPVPAEVVVVWGLRDDPKGHDLVTLSVSAKWGREGSSHRPDQISGYGDA